MEFVDYKRSPSGEASVEQLPDVLANIFGPGCSAHVILRLDAAELEAAKRLREAGQWPDHQFASTNQVLVRVSYSSTPVRFTFVGDEPARASMVELQQLLSSVPLDLSRPTCTALIGNRLLDIVADKGAFAEVVDKLAQHVRERAATHVASIEARGWLFAPAVAQRAGVRFIPILKNGCRPEEEADDWVKDTCHEEEVVRGRFAGRAGALGTTLCVNRAHIQGGNVLLVDDWIETGSEATTARRLVQTAGGTWSGLSVLRDGLATGPARAEIGAISCLYRPSSVP